MTYVNNIRKFLVAALGLAGEVASSQLVHGEAETILVYAIGVLTAAVTYVVPNVPLPVAVPEPVTPYAVDAADPVTPPAV